MRLDRIDFEIVEALQNDARLSNKELAARIDLAPSSCLERVRRLRDSGVLRGAHEEIEPAAVGVGLQAMIAVRLIRHSREMVEAFQAHAMTRPEVVSIYHVAGEDDFLVHVAARDAEHLRDMAMDEFTTRPEVARVRTALIYGRQRNWAMPRLIDPGS